MKSPSYRTIRARVWQVTDASMKVIKTFRYGQQTRAEQLMKELRAKHGVPFHVVPAQDLIRTNVR